jgi:pyruvate,water dikinase
VQRWTGLPSGEVLGVLKGAAPVSRGVGARPLERLRTALAEAGITAESVRGRPARDVLDDLRSRQGVAEPLQAYLDEVAYRLVSGYDIADKYALEMPEMLVGAIFGAADTADRNTDFVRRRDALRAKVPEAHRAEFDQWLEEARFIFRLRDERGMYNDSWGTGLARRAVLEAGRRLEDGGVLPDASLAVNASHWRSSACSGAGRSRASRSCAVARRGATPGRSPTRRRFSARSRRRRRPPNGCRRRRRRMRGPWTRSSARSST